jgi:hypothetical protein
MRCHNRIALALIAIIALGGCASMQTVSHKVPTTPALGQPATQTDSDATGCDKIAYGTPRESRLFAACMLAKGYTSRVQLDEGPYLSVIPSAKADRDKVVSTLDACETAALGTPTEEERKSARKARGGKIAGALLGGAVGAAIFAGAAATGADIDSIMTDAFAKCLQPHGYVVRPWQVEIK